MKLNFKSLFLLAFLLLSPWALEVVMAQPGPPPSGGPPCWPPPCIPIDGGIGILVAAGALYGGKKVLDSYKGKS